MEASICYLMSVRRSAALVVLNKIIVTSEQQTTWPRLERCTSRFQFWGPGAIKKPGVL